ncbi:MAG: 50S ribosomal protein L24 [Burkholderiales bacterium]
MNKLKKGDEVLIVTGKDKGKRGAILKMGELDRVLVEGINRVKKHTKPNPMKGTTGGITEKEMPIHISNVAIFNPITRKADKVGIKKLDDGRRVRVFKSSGEMIDA